MRRSKVRTLSVLKTKVRVGSAAVTLLVAAVAACGQQPESARGADEQETLDSPDSVGALARLIESRRRSFTRVSEEKDTLIHTLHTAMLLFNELSELEREIVGVETRRAEVALEPWDRRVRDQLDRLRGRYAELAGGLARTQERLHRLESRDALQRESLEEARRTAAELREDNESKRARIAELVARVAALTGERDAAVALSVARGDTIRTLVDESHVVYWVAGTEDELKQQGLIETVGGRHLLFTRVGEMLAPSRTLDVAHFERADRRSTAVIDLPDDAEYEIVTSQDPRFADARTLRQAGDRWRVRGELRITDPRFWEPTRFLILVRRQ